MIIIKTIFSLGAGYLELHLQAKWMILSHGHTLLDRN